MYFPLFVGVLCFVFVLLCITLYVHSNFATILKRERKLFALLLLFYRCIVTIKSYATLPHDTVCGLQCVNVVFPNRTHLLLEGINRWALPDLYLNCLKAYIS